LQKWIVLMTNTDDNLRRVALKKPIVGQPRPDDFELIEEEIPSLVDGQVLLKAKYISVDPGTRSRLSAGASYARPLQSGETVDGFCVGEVIESRHPKFGVGTHWAYGGGWASHCLTNGRGFFQPVPEQPLPLSLWIGVLGVPGMTAYFGLQRVAGLQAGDRVLVSSAAGPVGATAGQLAKAWGASKVVGIAGGPAKCGWVSGPAGFDDCVDYKAQGDLTAALSAACPEGYDVFFDNVGNAMIDAVLPLMRPGGRIVISGQVGDYNAIDPPGLKGTRHFIAARLRMEGIVVFDDLKQFARAQAELSEKIEAGSLVYREERFAGLEALPAAFCGLFTGDSFGRRIVVV
jgi:NADPH-dependent curcumin reductase CurA